MDTDDARAQAERDREASANNAGGAPARRGRPGALIAGVIVAALVLAGVIYAVVERNGETTSSASDTRDHTNVAKAPEAPPAPPPAAQPSEPAPAPPSPAAPPEATPAPSETAQQPPASPPAPDQTAQQPARPMSQEPAALPSSEELVVQVQQANIRATASLHARVVARAAKGDKLKVIGRSGKWVEVQTQAGSGWISGKLLGTRAP